MPFLQTWTQQEAAQNIMTSVCTASGDVTLNSTLLAYVLCTHVGKEPAVIELFDGDRKALHLESPGYDRSPFGISVHRPILFKNKVTLHLTATGANVSFGYYNYSV